ncbi:hypothetical protein, partial [Helicobacter sp. 11S02596-1]|uniref:hypothetical protein n=1 Tax=Helicobacter sp. 11S02596-1 TaxID=1476194 RepID=UPI00117BA8BD
MPKAKKPLTGGGAQSNTSQPDKNPDNTNTPQPIDPNHLHLFTANIGEFQALPKDYQDANLVLSTYLGAEGKELYFMIQPSEAAKAKSVEQLMKEAKIQENRMALNQKIQKNIASHKNAYYKLKEIYEILPTTIKAMEKNLENNSEETNEKINEEIQNHQAMDKKFKQMDSLGYLNALSTKAQGYVNQALSPSVKELKTFLEQNKPQKDQFPELSDEKFQNITKKYQDKLEAMVASFNTQYTTYLQKLEPYKGFDLKTERQNKITEAYNKIFAMATQKEQEITENIKNLEETKKKIEEITESLQGEDYQKQKQALEEAKKDTATKLEKYTTDWKDEDKKEYDTAKQKEEELNKKIKDIDKQVTQKTDEYLKETIAKAEQADSEYQTIQKQLEEAKDNKDGNPSKGIPTASIRASIELGEEQKELNETYISQLEATLAELANLNASDLLDYTFSMDQTQIKILDGIKNLSDALAPVIIAHINDTKTLKKISDGVQNHLEKASEATKNDTTSESMGVIFKSSTTNRLSMLSNPFGGSNNSFEAMIKKAMQYKYADNGEG